MRRHGLELAVWLALLCAPLLLKGWLLLQLAQFLSYGILAMSLALVWGQSGLLCFGQAVFFGLGAYAMSLVTLGLVPGLEVLTYSWAGVLAAILLPAAAANLLGRFLFYGKGLRGAYFGIVTLAIAVIVERLATNWSYIGGLNGLMNVPPVTLGRIGAGIEIWDNVAVFYIALAVAFPVYLLLEMLVRSPYGVLLRALRDNEERAAFLGYDTAREKLRVFTLGAAVAGLAGAPFVTQFSFVSPAVIGFQLSTEALIWVALGGREWLLAALLGALLVRVIESYLSDLLGAAWLLTLGLLFMATVVLFPRGLVATLLRPWGGSR